MLVNPKRAKLLILVMGLLPLMTLSAKHSTSPDLHNQSLSWLENRLADIDHELATLANFSLRSGTGAIGYRSNFYDDEFHSEWVEITLDNEYPLDEVVLVPVIRRDAKHGFQADGFPKHLRLIVGTNHDTNGTIIAEYTDEQDFLPRVAPLSIPCNGITASWIRIETGQLSLRAFDEQYVFQLAEIMAFSGNENVALQKKTRSKSNQFGGRAWAKHFAVDGFIPYLMDAAAGEKSIAFVSGISSNSAPALTIDLGEPQVISRLNLHAVDPSDLLPQAQPSEFGIPRDMRLEAANNADFSDGHTLINLHLESVYNMGPIIKRKFPAATNRYFRLHIDSPPKLLSYTPNTVRFGFAEIELLDKGENRALAKTVTGMALHENLHRPLSLLTDGRNMYGTILPLRAWMRQLSRRHDLEAERPLVEQALNRLYERQKTNLRRLGWLSALLAVGIGFTILIDRLFRMRKIQQIEQRIAADLHDELGANLHTIGLLSDLAESSKDDPEELAVFHQRIRAVTERSGIAVRSCTDMLNSDDLYKGLVADMQRAAQRSLAKLDHALTIEGEEHLGQLNRRTCVDLFLFYKESLVNISRHSGATEFATKLIVRPKELELTISDNGRGFAEAEENEIPKSLKRRAKLLGAKVAVESPPNGGTRILLKLRIRKPGRLK
ncbi:histidine kinase [Pontiellaceae bacterium B12227]|nr:histidine kinase [Pontiellaceae bacterium B12227]